MVIRVPHDNLLLFHFTKRAGVAGYERALCGIGMDLYYADLMMDYRSSFYSTWLLASSKIIKIEVA
ncbi:hypothetical protein ASU89_01285 [Enterobacter hormaechei subsp. steigerwaltii]|nr:hypothetical protein ASU89_01285 [Enterobacter hormaechei subsp. steigerwaltii]KYO12049.1 hypothetical protein ABF67_0203265 [Enterobacter hormaechei subsp. steigerwaltii]